MSLRTWNEIVSAAAGTIVINDTTAYTAKPVYAVYVVEDTVFNVLTDGDGNDKTDYITTPATAVKAGVLITPFDKQKPFVNIDLTSGSVVAIL
jgi:hypothetical protein